MKVGFVGLGSMGWGMASVLVKEGFDVLVYNRTLEKAVKFSEKFKVRYFRELGSLVRESDIIHVMVSDDEAVTDVIMKSIEYLGKGKTLVNSTTITPGVSSLLNNILSSKGVKYVEAPVLGSVTEASEGRLITYVGGEPEDAEIPTLKAYSSRVIYIGPVPQASAVKLAVNNLFLAIVASLAESIALVEGWGVEPEVYAEVIRGTWMKPIIERYFKRGMDLGVRVRFKMSLAAKDSAYVADSLRLAGLPGLVASAVSQVYLKGVTLGYGDRDYTNVIGVLDDLAKKLRGSRKINRI